MSERRGTYFEKWAEAEGIPVVRGYSMENLYQLPLKWWERKGGFGALIILEGGEGWTSAYVCEIPPKTSLKPQRHYFEEQIYVLTGRAETKVWAEGIPEQTFSWQEYSLFSPPLNAWHQHRNPGDEPARYVAVTNAPVMFNLLGSADLIFNANIMSRDRLSGWSRGFFDGVGNVVGDEWRGGLMLDVRKPELPESVMGERFGLRFLRLSSNIMVGHIGELAVGHYKKIHRHAGGAHIIIPNGEGYSLIWKEESEKIRVDWKKGSIFSPPEGWFHVHFNTCGEPVRQVALRYGGLGTGKIYKPGLDMKHGGDQVEYEDEPPEIRKIYEQELSKKGLQMKMSPVARKV